jgi:hypothetical protein
MSPAVEAAVIAGSAGILTLIGTLAAQFYGIHRTSRDSERTLEEQRKQLDKTLGEQRTQLDKTLGEQRTRTWNERFATAAGQLGSDKPPAVRLAGVYAMAGLADDWEESRQTCVDVLCGYLRIPYAPDPGDGEERLAFLADREVRYTVIRIIAAHLRAGARVSWQGKDFDLTGVVFDGGDFTDAEFSGGRVKFIGAKFSGVGANFGGAKFSGSRVDFHLAKFSGAAVAFYNAEFSGGMVAFYGAEFSGGMVAFGGAKFSGAEVDFYDAEFSGSRVGFTAAKFSGGVVNFGRAKFSGGEVGFTAAEFSGSEVDFVGAEFSGGKVDFRGTGDWSFPPAFPWTDTPPPPGVMLPKKEDQSQA